MKRLAIAVTLTALLAIGLTSCKKHVSVHFHAGPAVTQHVTAHAPAIGAQYRRGALSTFPG